MLSLDNGNTNSFWFFALRRILCCEHEAQSVPWLSTNTTGSGQCQHSFRLLFSAEFSSKRMLRGTVQTVLQMHMDRAILHHGTHRLVVHAGSTPCIHAQRNSSAAERHESWPALRDTAADKACQLEAGLLQEQVGQRRYSFMHGVQRGDAQKVHANRVRSPQLRHIGGNS